MTTTNKKWAIALAVSVGLNLFLLGAVTVHVVGRRAGSNLHAPGSERRMGRIGRTPVDEGGPALLREMVQILGGPHDPRVQKLWSERRHGMKKFRGDLEAARSEVRTALTREPFDRPALEKSLQRLHVVQSEAQQHSQDAVLALAGELRPDERQKLADAPREPRR